MSTRIPSSLWPSTVAVTTTRVSLPTKFRMHRCECRLCEGSASRSNLRACVPAASSSRLQKRDRARAMVANMLDCGRRQQARNAVVGESQEKRTPSCCTRFNSQRRKGNLSPSAWVSTGGCLKGGQSPAGSWAPFQRVASQMPHTGARTPTSASRLCASWLLTLFAPTLSEHRCLPNPLHPDNAHPSYEDLDKCAETHTST